MLDDDQRANFKKLDINDVLVDTSAMDELMKIGREELFDAPNLDSKQLVGDPSLRRLEDDEDKLYEERADGSIYFPIHFSDVYVLTKKNYMIID